ncbi:ATP-binding cassette domain-containing protein [Maricaulis sp.]|uniref:ABC transporter ATP-binding protein n=1 Tax=Maricaulis sp. TaxID=1486257 RepID=UPI00262035AF|nr:ATP-binding cassette domain-containing protein [Maricaulis sp.]MDF1769369.1 ATP-binding cassette domain-containing protein [Maricaulis sp.]
MSKLFLEADNVTVSYPHRGVGGLKGVLSPETTVALAKISFSLEVGDRLGLLGRNGSGKSTLLRTLAGIYPPQSGHVRHEGKIGAVFNASLGFLPNATGYENIFMRGAYMGLAVAQTRKLIPYIEEFSELGEWLDRPLSSYSSGMALRLAFSITTSVDNEILLLDEWLGAGDAAFLVKARERMHEMIERTGILVLATHNLQLMSRVCNKAMVLDEGKILEAGPVEEVLTRYRSLTVQRRTDLLGGR